MIRDRFLYRTQILKNYIYFYVTERSNPPLGISTVSLRSIRIILLQGKNTDINRNWRYIPTKDVLLRNPPKGLIKLSLLATFIIQ